MLAKAAEDGGKTHVPLSAFLLSECQIVPYYASLSNKFVIELNSGGRLNVSYLLVEPVDECLDLLLVAANQKYEDDVNDS